MIRNIYYSLQEYLRMAAFGGFENAFNTINNKFNLYFHRLIKDFTMLLLFFFFHFFT